VQGGVGKVPQAGPEGEDVAYTEEELEAAYEELSGVPGIIT